MNDTAAILFHHIIDMEQDQISARLNNPPPSQKLLDLDRNKDDR